MKNKVLVNLMVPEIDRNFDVYLPINKKIGNIINLLNKTISEMSNGEYKESITDILYNVTTGERYYPDVLLVNTNIRNGTKLVLLSNLK